MPPQSHSVSKHHLFLFIALITVGIVFLAAALFQPKAIEPPGWTALNEQVEHTLSQIVQSDGAHSGAAVTDSGTGGQAGGESKEKHTGGTAAAGGTAKGVTSANGSGAAGPVASGSETAEPAASGSETAEPAASGSGTAGPAVNVSGTVGPAVSGSGSAETAGDGASDGRIDINRASAEELDKLPGIGMAKAKTIVDDREKNGPFRSADDLLRVKGIGPKLLDKMKPSIVAGS